MPEINFLIENNAAGSGIRWRIPKTCRIIRRGSS
ncbi:hypothetical protein GGE24_007410 [Bradyrhizobium centrosematis]|nr:hypothetical protein [Bradyrhizobium centrosematis]MCS3778035.1 hypothetical protein [Bradyrhizobium centrosematis]